jgi:hypothetical protein
MGDVLGKGFDLVWGSCGCGVLWVVGVAFLCARRTVLAWWCLGLYLMGKVDGGGDVL